MSDNRPELRASSAAKRNALGVPYVSVKRGRYELRPPLRFVPEGDRGRARPVTASAPVAPGDAAWVSATPAERLARGVPMPAGLRELAEELARQMARLERRDAESAARGLPGATVDQVFDARVEASEVKNKEELRKLYKKHVQPALGRRRVADCANARDVEAVLAPLRSKAASTIRHVYHCITGIFEHAFKQDQVPSLDFLRKVTVPRGKGEDKRPRVLLSDEEVAAFVRHPDVPLYLRTMAMVCRYLGGCRASDAHALRWEHFSPGLETVFIERPKTGDDDPRTLRHEVPEGVRKYLRELHLELGRPTAGHVFGRRRARRKGAGDKGTRKGRGVGYARRLRFWLKRIHVERYELHNDTATTRRVDWHSFRRGYCTELARLGVNEQTAMKLAGHKDPRTHKRYVTENQTVSIPADKLPDLAKSG